MFYVYVCMLNIAIYQRKISLFMFKQELTVRKAGIPLPIYKIIWGSTVSGYIR